MNFHMFIAILNIAEVTQIFRFTSTFTQQDTLSGTPTMATLVLICCFNNPADAGCTNSGDCNTIAN